MNHLKGRARLWFQNLITIDNCGSKSNRGATWKLLQIASQVYETVQTAHRGSWTEGNWFNLVGRKPVSLRPRRTISIGNVSVGGSGKTPMTIFLAENLTKNWNKRILVLTRDYGQDEARMMSHVFERYENGAIIGIGSNRGKVAQKIFSQQRQQQKQIDTVLLDDGLQHFALERDVNIVMINAVNGVTGSYADVLPLGALRESWSSGLSRASIVVLHHSNLVDGESRESLEKFAKHHSPPGCPIFHSKVVYNFDVSMLDVDYSLVVFCGVASPKSLEIGLLNYLSEKMSSKFEKIKVELFPFADHHEFTKQELQKIVVKYKRKERNVLFATTAKDFFRCESVIIDCFKSSRFVVLDTSLEIMNGQQGSFLKKCIE